MKKPTSNQAIRRTSSPVAEPSESPVGTADMQELDVLLAERDLLKKSLEAMQGEQADALHSIRLSQDLAAEVQRLQRMLAESQMRTCELEGRCQDLERAIRGLSAERDGSLDREHALQASLAGARIHFQERVEQLGQSLAALQRLREPDKPDNEAA